MTRLHDVSAGGVTFCHVVAVVRRHLDQPVVGADPDQRRVQRRRRDRVDDAALAVAIGVARGDVVEIRGDAGIGARQVGADLRPRLRAVGRLEEELVRVVERVRIGLREHQRLRPVRSRRLRADGLMSSAAAD